jgi:hypothetical protein
MKKTTAEKRAELINQIAENNVYLEGSALREMVKESLRRLSLRQLHNLAVIIDCKIHKS